MDAREAARFVNRSHQAIMRGTLTLRRAREWARMIVRGEADPAVLDRLDLPTPVLADNVWQFRAQGGLSDEIMSILQQLADAVGQLSGPQPEPAPTSFARLFPEYAQGGMTGPGHYPVSRDTCIYDGDTQGRPGRQPRMTSWDGYVRAAGPGDLDDELPDDVAALFAPSSRQEAENRHWAREAQAGRVLDYSDAEVYAALFGGEDE